ncbi:protein ripply1 isoform X1 [Gallus gallus]|nr:protein ripply1 isoform X1 [Gallus gallus]
MVSNFSLLCFAFPQHPASSPPQPSVYTTGTNFTPWGLLPLSPQPNTLLPQRICESLAREGLYIKLSSQRACSLGGDTAATMEAAACCLPLRRLPLPTAGACPAPGLQQGGRTKPLWRPWLPQEEYMTRRQREQMDTAQPLDAAGDHSSDKALALFRHPVRLLWPKSRCFDYLYSVGEKLLENFPVQATLCLYDDSDSEGDEAEDDDEDGDEGNEGEAGGAVAAVGAGSPRPA